MVNVTESYTSLYTLLVNTVNLVQFQAYMQKVPGPQASLFVA